LTVSPQSIDLSASGATKTFSVNESPYGGAFHATAASSCAGIASVDPGSSAAEPSTFTVTAGSNPGTCAITVSDYNGQSSTVNVTVTITQGTIQ
jgi:hypothetical protein